MKETSTSINLNYIEECYMNILAKSKVDDNLKSIQRTLNREFKNYDCEEIFVLDTTRADKFFGMRVYPTKTIATLIEQLMDYFLQNPEKLDENNIEKKINEFAGKEIRKSISYILEIDGRMLTDHAINITPRELTAITLHEVGHIVNDFDKNVKRLIYTFLLSLIRYKSVLKYIGVIKQLKVYKSDIILLYIMNAFNSLGFATESERCADNLAIQYGYGKELVDIINKMIKCGLKLKEINKSSKDVYDDTTCFADWTIKNFLNLEYRKREIIGDLKRELDNEKSPYITIAVQKFINDLNRFKLSIMQEGAIEEFNEQVIQEMFNLFKKPKVAQRDIDEIKIDIESMQDYDDKIVILNKIHKRIEQVDSAANRFKNDKEMMETLTSYKEQLKVLVAKLLNTKVVEKEWGVFIKYPKGYEG